MMSDQGTIGNTFNQQIDPGTPVYDVNGEKIGHVSDQSVPGQYLVVEKGLIFRKDLYIPFSAISTADANGIYLNLYKDDLSDQRYEQPLMDTGATTLTGGTVNTGTTDTVYTNTTTPVANTVTTGTTTAANTATTGTTTAANVTTDQDIRVPVQEEELIVGKRQEQIGDVHLHKDVVTEQQSVPVQLQREQVTVERVPVDQQVDAGTLQDAFKGEDIDVPVMGEEAVVGKQVRETEEVRLRKQAITDQQQVSDTVRKERVTVDGQDVDTLNNTGTGSITSQGTLQQ